MEVLVIGDEHEKRKEWISFLTNSIPNLTFIDCNTADELKEYSLSGNNMILCLGAKFNSDIRQGIDLCITANIPVVCLTESLNEHYYNALIAIGVKGIINSNIASLDTIKTAFRMVIQGGIYVDSPSKNSLIQIEQDKKKIDLPSLDLIEWNVFSLTSKGYSGEEIAQQLQLAVSEIEVNQMNIIGKLKGKTMAGVVATGINKGWLKE